MGSIDPVTVLENATRILSETGLCKQAYAKDRDGKPVSAFDDRADSFCVVGAIQRSCQELGDQLMTAVWPTFDLLTPYMHPGQITIWNDGATSEQEVLSVLRSACSAARQPAVAA